MRISMLYFCAIFLFINCRLPGLDKTSLNASRALLLSRLGIDSTINSIQLSASKASFQVLTREEKILLSTEPPDQAIYYTVDGAVPTNASLKYNGGIVPNLDYPGKTIKAKSILDSGVESNLLELHYFYPITKTGQTNCYRYSDNVLEPCDPTHTDQDGRLQKGITQNFSGPNTNSGFPNDYISKDEVYGLTWTSCKIGLTGNNCVGTATEVTGQLTNPEDLCSQLNIANAGSGYAGIQNWRLPGLIELSQIAIHQLSPLTRYNEAAFPNLNTAPITIHGSRNPSLAAQRFYYSINNTFYGSQAEGATRGTLCVSGNQTPTTVNTDLGDGTFKDELHGLVWTKCLAGQSFPDCTGAHSPRNFLDSINFCRNLTLSGRTWRLPNLNELDSLVNPNETATPKLFAKDLFSAEIIGKVLRSSTSESAGSARRITPDNLNNSTGGAAALKTDNSVANICVSDDR